MNRIAIYTRTAVSDERAHERQEVICEQYAHRHLDVEPSSIVVYGDTHSARRDRDGYVNMLDAVQRDEVDVVIVSSLDRLVRNAVDFARLLAVLDEHDCTLVSVTEDLDTSTPMGNAITSIAVLIAQLEVEAAR